MALFALASGPVRTAWAGDPPRPALPAPAADPAAADDPKPEATAPKKSSVSVAKLLRDAAALRAVVVEKSPLVAAADARIAQAQADVGAAHVLLPNPAVDMTAGGLVIGDTNPAKPHLTYGDTALFDVGLSQTIEIGKRGPRIAAAGSRLESAKALAQSTTQDAVGDAREALGRVAYYAARSAIDRKSVV